MRLGLFPKRKVFEFEEPTIIVQWLVRLIIGDVPPFDQVGFKPTFAVDLYRGAKSYGIDGPNCWIGRLLAERVASDPWGCLARAWKSPDIDFNLIETVINMLPSYDVLSFATTVHAQVKDLRPAEMLCLYPFGRHITLFKKQGSLKVDFPPFFAFALSITRAVKRSQYNNERAANGDMAAFRLLLFGILLEYGHAWGDTVRLGKSSDWIAEYIE